MVRFDPFPVLVASESSAVLRSLELIIIRNGEREGGRKEKERKKGKEEMDRLERTWEWLVSDKVTMMWGAHEH